MSEWQTQIYEFGEFRVDVAKRLLTKGNDESVRLTPKVFDTLLYLVRHHGKVIEKTELMREIWADTVVEENNLSQNISILRRALGEKPGEHRFIATVSGHGFRFVPEVSEIRERIEIEENERGGEEVESGSPKGFVARKVIRTPGVWMTAIAVIAIVGLGIVVFGFWGVKFAPAREIKTIAVLPFKLLVLEQRDESLEIGMADTLIVKLGSSQEIAVRPLTSIRKYAGLEQDALVAGRELGVDAVLDGSIQRRGDAIRVNVRLVKTVDGTSLWTGTFDETIANVFAVQDAISKKVAAALRLRLSGDEQKRLSKRDTENVEAYQFYMKGRYHHFKLTQPEIRKGISFYQQAIDADPNYALAYAGMADAYRILPIVGWNMSSKEAIPQAKAAARKALELDEDSAEAHIVLGWIKFSFDWDWAAAESEFKKAIKLSPNNSDAHRAYAHLLSNLGRHTEAIAGVRRARELDPLSLITNALEGQFLFYAGRDDEAIIKYQKALEIEPNFWIAQNGLGRIYLRQGRFMDAIAAMNKAKELSGGSTEPITQLGYTLAKAGMREQARATLEELQSIAAERYVPACSFAVIYNGLGERDEALKYLEKSFQEREVQITFIRIDTRWDEIRADPRFQDLLRRINL